MTLALPTIIFIISLLRPTCTQYHRRSQISQRLQFHTTLQMSSSSRSIIIRSKNFIDTTDINTTHIAIGCSTMTCIQKYKNLSGFPQFAPKPVNSFPQFIITEMLFSLVNTRKIPEQCIIRNQGFIQPVLFIPIQIHHLLPMARKMQKQIVASLHILI